MGTTLFLIRHAHRDKSDPDANNGISKKGQDQCFQLVDFLKRTGRAVQITELISSPKLRCLETAFPVGKLIRQSPLVDPRIDEQGKDEKDATFEKRLWDFWSEKSRQSGLALVSHGDVLPRLAGFEHLQVDKILKGQLLVLENGKIRYLNPLKVLESKA